MKKIFTNSILFLLGFVPVLLFCDLFINFGGIYTVNNTQYSEGIGKTIRPNLPYIYFNEGFSIGKTTAYGTFGTEYNQEKDHATLRIALLGDSYIEGIQLFKRDHFATILETQLNLNTKTEVLNFGRSEFSLGHMYASEKRIVDQFNPALILYFIEEGSLENDYKDPLLPKTILIDDRLQFNATTSKIAQRRFELANTVLKHSAFLSMVNNSKRYLTTSNFRRLVALPKTPSPYETTHTKLDSLPPLSKRILQKLDTVHTRLVWRSEKEIPPYLSDYCQLINLKIINLAPLLQKMINEGNHPNYWKVTNTYGHWNHGAHTEIGRYLSKNIEGSFLNGR